MLRIPPLFIFLFFSCILSAQVLNIAPVPQEILYSHHNDDFTVCVRIPNGDWQDLYEYKVMVDGDKPQPASMVQFDFEGNIRVRKFTKNIKLK